MTRLSFILRCNKNLIIPELALENDKIIKALKNRDDKKVFELLDTEF